MNLEDAHRQFSDIMSKAASELDKRQELIKFAKNIGACTRHPSNDLAPASQAELIQHILARFQMLGLVETCKINKASWVIAVISSAIALLSALAAWTAVLKK
jgi:hypothetical protein